MEMPAGKFLSTTLLRIARRWSVLTALGLVISSAGFFGLRDFVSNASAVNEERTISFYNIHNKETITVTYKKNGRYIPSAMKKLNHFLRDWRQNQPTRMDPKVIDLVWELRQELGSTAPTHLISGYRSPKTNAMLRRNGRKVARRSMHMKGQATDVYFPDVSLVKLRNSALVRQVGGVGYYPRSGKKGFVHVDTGNVRHWPRLSQKKLAKIFRNHKKKRQHAPRQNEKGPIYLAQRNRANNNTTVAASRNNVKRSLRTANAIPLPRPKPTVIEPAIEQPVTAQPAVPSAPAKPMPTVQQTLTLASLGPTPRAPAAVEPEPKLRRSLVFFPLAILKREAQPGLLTPSTEDSPVTVQQVAAITGSVKSYTISSEALEFVRIDNTAQRHLTASQLARVARQIVTRTEKSNLMMSRHSRPVANETAKGGFLNAAATIIDLRGPSVSSAMAEVQEAVREEPVDAAGEQPVAIPAGAALGLR